jgi:hypothetical protein
VTTKPSILKAKGEAPIVKPNVMQNVKESMKGEYEEKEE